MKDFNRRQKRCVKAIETVLTQLRKKESPTETMDSLAMHFASPSAILESGAHTLMQEGLNEAEAQLFQLIPDLTRHSMRAKFGDYPKIDRLSVAREYLKTLYIGVPIEQFNVLYLDSGGRLIQCKMLQKGNVDETPFYLEHLLQDVIFSGASAIVLSHNHPGGTLRPSQADIRCTLNAIIALVSLNVLLLDHIIIADDQAVSLRDTAHIAVPIWNNQDPSSALLRNWLDVSL